MEILMKVSFLCFLFPLLCKAAANDCPASSFCGRNYFPVRFPFQFNTGGSQRPTRGNNCGYPGFNLSCDNQGQVILTLPNSGDFYVRNINYRDHMVQLYDQFKCLPGRLLNLNLSGSSFQANNARNYTYISCPADVTRGRFTSIDCLSNSSTSIIATSSASRVAVLTYQTPCRIIAVVPVQYNNEFSSTLFQDLYLTWDKPNCQDCEARGGICGFSSSSRQDIICSDKPGGTVTGGLNLFKIIAISIAIPAMTCSIIITIFICLSGGRRANGQQNLTLSAVMPAETETPIVIQGLDESTIESYTKVVLGESMRVPGLNDVTCPICLSNYNAKETVRCIPECKHCFHAECIDEWLRINGTCPVCRNSPSPVHPHS